MSEILREFIPSRPDGWTEARIGEALTEIDRPIQMRDLTEYRLASIRRRNGGMFHRETLPGRRILTKTLREVVPRSFVLARMQVVHGACALVPDEFAGHAISKSYSSFVGTTKCDIRFFAHLAKQPFMYRYFMDASQGVVIEKMTFDQDRWLSFPVYLPPVDEQRRIAEILETIDEAIRAAALLISKLQLLRAGLIDEALRFVRIQRRAELGSLLQSAVDGPFGSALKSEHYVDQPGTRVVRLANLGDGEFVAQDKAFISDEYAKHLARHTVQGGDVLVASLGDDHHHPGRACVFPPDEPAAIVKADCFRLRPLRGVLHPAYLALYLNWTGGRSQVRSIAQGVTRDRVNLTNLKTITIDLPTWEAQDRISDLVADTDARLRTEVSCANALKNVRLGLRADLLSGRVRSVAT